MAAAKASPTASSLKYTGAQSIRRYPAAMADGRAVPTWSRSIMKVPRPIGWASNMVVDEDDELLLLLLLLLDILVLLLLLV